MIRFILLGLALYLASKIVGSLFKSSSADKKPTVKGESKKEALDLSEDDVVDVDYKEIKE